MKIQIVTHHHGLVAMWTENDVTDHEVAHRFDMGLLALEAAHGNVPRIDVW